jgi:hypothetical protein
VLIEISWSLDISNCQFTMHKSLPSDSIGDRFDIVYISPAIATLWITNGRKMNNIFESDTSSCEKEVEVGSEEWLMVHRDLATEKSETEISFWVTKNAPRKSAE